MSRVQPGDKFLVGALGDAEPEDVTEGKTFSSREAGREAEGTRPELEGNAEPEDVLAGKVFSSSEAGYNVEGTLSGLTLEDEDSDFDWETDGDVNVEINLELPEDGVIIIGGLDLRVDRAATGDIEVFENGSSIGDVGEAEHIFLERSQGSYTFTAERSYSDTIEIWLEGSAYTLG